jgi:hypothetical protein
MKTLLVLGSKPEPRLPPEGVIDAVACANASGHSAAHHGLPVPAFTVLSAILGTGIASGRQSLAALRGLRTEGLEILPRPPRTSKGRFSKRLSRSLLELRSHPLHLRYQLRRVGYQWARCQARPLAVWHDLVHELCRHDPAILEQMRRKQPSTGLFAVALALTEGGADRVLMAGFSFELTHAYGPNPEIQERGTAISRHGDTDVMVLSWIARNRQDLWTTEPVVAERTGLPLFDSPAHADPVRRTEWLS